MPTCITKEPGIHREVSSCYLALNRNAGSALKLPKTDDRRINRQLVIEIMRESLKEVLRYRIYYNFRFSLALILNRW